MARDTWNNRIAAVWDDDALSDAERIRTIDQLAGTLAFNDPRGLFERDGARDAAGLEHEAIPLYLAALQGGLSEYEAVQATIQLASSYRNTGNVDEAVRVLENELADPERFLRDEVAVFLAVSYASAGTPQKGVALLMRRMAPGLALYERSVYAYADALDATPTMPTANTGETSR